MPETCSAKVNDVPCCLPPTYIFSIASHDGEYMVTVVCDDHKEAIERRLANMQRAGKVPSGKIHMQPVKAVVTNCVKGIEEDYVEIELKRGSDFENP